MKQSHIDNINFLSSEEKRLGVDFMNKSLSEGCWIKYNNSNGLPGNLKNGYYKYLSIQNYVDDYGIDIKTVEEDFIGPLDSYCESPYLLNSYRVKSKETFQELSLAQKQEYISPNEIIGHYGLSSILKYILLKRDCQIFTLPFTKGRIQDKLIIAPKQDGIYKWVSKYNFEFPNEEPHLRTDEQNIKALADMKKLKAEKEN